MLYQVCYDVHYIIADFTCACALYAHAHVHIKLNPSCDITSYITIKIKYCA